MAVVLQLDCLSGGGKSVEHMTFGEARARLRRYYRVLELVEESGFKSTDIILVVPGGTQAASSPEIADAIRRVDLLASVKDVEEALAAIAEEHRRLLELRYKHEYGLRTAGRELHMSKDAVWRAEVEALSAFILALGKVPEGEDKN